MLSKLISPNDKIELQAIDRGEEENAENKKIYYSTVLDILSEDTLEIAMPMEQSKLILLPVDSEYDLVFYGEGGLYQCFARIIDRYKSNNVYMLAIELTSNLRKFQRREYYRFSCALEMCARNLEEDEVQAIEKRLPYALVSGRPMKQSVIVDISGGGLRFVSSQKYEPGNLLYCSYHLIKGNDRKQYEVIGKVLSAKESEKRPGVYEHRVQYYDMDNETREEIIKYIFEEERKSLQKERR